MAKSKVFSDSESTTYPSVEDASLVHGIPAISNVVGLSGTSGNGRDNQGLLVGISHPFTPEGFVDWRRMLKPEHLIPDPKRFHDKTQEELSTVDVLSLPDDQVQILLSGIKYLALLRGVKGVNHEITLINENFVGVKTTIRWIDNFEVALGRPSMSVALADAHPLNTSQMGSHYLSAIAENRGFTRAVRNGLGINVVGKEEVNPADKSDSLPQTMTGLSTPHETLERVLKEKGYTFAQLKLKLMKSSDHPGATAYASVRDIPVDRVIGIIERLRKPKQT